MNQRWRARRDLYRPADEVINTREYEITETRSDQIVKGSSPRITTLS